MPLHHAAEEVDKVLLDLARQNLSRAKLVSVKGEDSRTAADV